MEKRNLVGVGVIILVFLALTQFAEAQKVQSGDQRTGRFILGLAWVFSLIRLMAQPLPLGQAGIFT